MGWITLATVVPWTRRQSQTQGSQKGQHAALLPQVSGAGGPSPAWTLIPGVNPIVLKGLFLLLSESPVIIESVLFFSPYCTPGEDQLVLVWFVSWPALQQQAPSQEEGSANRGKGTPRWRREIWGTCPQSERKRFLVEGLAVRQ